MKFEVLEFNASAFVGSGQQPAVVAPVGKGAREYWIPQAAAFDPEMTWSIVHYGPHMRVPVFAYKTALPTMEVVFATGVQIGMSLLHALGPEAENPTEALLVMGRTCDDLRPEEEAYRLYIGAAFRLK